MIQIFIFFSRKRDKLTNLVRIFNVITIRKRLLKYAIEMRIW